MRYNFITSHGKYSNERITLRFVTFITNFMGHNLAIIVVRNLFFIGLYGINIDVIHLPILFERYCVHYLNINVICLFILFRHGCCMYICVIYTWKSCTWLSCLNNAQHLCLNDTNPWNNRFHMDLEQTHEAHKFMMLLVRWSDQDFKGIFQVWLTFYSDVKPFSTTSITSFKLLLFTCFL